MEFRLRTGLRPTSSMQVLAICIARTCSKLVADRFEAEIPLRYLIADRSEAGRHGPAAESLWRGSLQPNATHASHATLARILEQALALAIFFGPCTACVALRALRAPRLVGNRAACSVRQSDGTIMSSIDILTRVQSQRRRTAHHYSV